MLRNERGVTLLVLIIMVVIMAILVGVGITVRWEFFARSEIAKFLISNATNTRKSRFYA